MNFPKIHLPEHLPLSLSFTILVMVMAILAIAWVMNVTGSISGEMDLAYPIIFALAELAVMIEVLPPFFKRE